jgi:hypothetical protein
VITHHTTAVSKWNSTPIVQATDLPDGFVLNLTIGMDTSPLLVACNQSAVNSPGFYAAVYQVDCSDIYNNSKTLLNLTSNPNIREGFCERNCQAYSIEPLVEECIVLECYRGTSSNSIRKCKIYVNIKHPPSKSSTVPG